jgi:NADP-dependent 3-hydroxy acid dehydrogenase YdfG
LVDEITDIGEIALAVTCDVAQRVEFEDAAADVASELGPIRMFISNPGVHLHADCHLANRGDKTKLSLRLGSAISTGVGLVAAISSVGSTIGSKWRTTSQLVEPTTWPLSKSIVHPQTISITN